VSHWEFDFKIEYQCRIQNEQLWCSNTMILMVLIFIIFGIYKTVSTSRHLDCTVSPMMGNTMTSFHESFISPGPVKDTDNIREMIDFANSNESGRRAIGGE
jgi:hypothetical protein